MSSATLIPPDYAGSKVSRRPSEPAGHAASARSVLAVDGEAVGHDDVVDRDVVHRGLAQAQ
jgi:hypothetical protein